MINIQANGIGYIAGHAPTYSFANGEPATLQTLPAIGDTRAADFYAPASAYDVNVTYNKGPNAGIVDVQIDGVSIGTIDLYDAVDTGNHTASFTDVAISTGRHLLTLGVTGKNAGSSNYFANLGFISIVPR